MSVRGTSHAKLERKIVNHDRGGTFLVCAWMDCDKDAVFLYEVLNHEHVREIACDHPLAKHCTYAFCSERHKQYHLACTGRMAIETQQRNNGQVAGMLPPGWKKTIL